MKVFLGGTCNGSKWRDMIIPMLKVEYFNPVVDDWTEQHQQEELLQRDKCDICLYVITPKMTGTYSVAVVVDDSNKRTNKTVFVLLRKDGDEEFTNGQWKSLCAVSEMIKRNGAISFSSLESAAIYINSKKPEKPTPPPIC